MGKGSSAKNNKTENKGNKSEKSLSPKQQNTEEVNDKAVKAALRREKTDKLIAGAVGSLWFVPVTAVLCFAAICGICYMQEEMIFADDFKMQGIFHCLYVGDFSIGISSRLLIGSLLSLFTETLSADVIDGFAKVFLYLSFILQAFFAAVVIRKALREKNNYMLIIAAVFVVCPVTVCAYTMFFGVLDLYNYVLFIAAMIILIKGKSNLQLLIPLISAAGLLIHYSYFFAFFPALFVMGLYRAVSCEKKQLGKEAAALGLNTAVSVGGFFFLTLIAKNFMVMTPEQMLEHVHSKADKTVMIYDDYLMYYIYDIFKGTQMTDSASSLSALININGELRKPVATLQYLLFISLIALIFWTVMIILAKKEKDVKKKLPYIAACVMPFALVPELILSSDTWRWIASTTYCLFYVLFALYLMNPPVLSELSEKMKKMKPAGKTVISVILLAYFAYCFIFEHVIYD